MPTVYFISRNYGTKVVSSSDLSKSEPAVYVYGQHHRGAAISICTFAAVPSDYLKPWKNRALAEKAAQRTNFAPHPPGSSEAVVIGVDSVTGKLVEGVLPPLPKTSELTTFRIHLEDGSHYETNMAKGVTTSDVEQYFAQGPVVPGIGPEEGVAKRVTRVEQLS